MKRVLAICLLVIISAGSSYAGTYGGGNGTSEEPYQIWTAEQMNAIGTDPNDLDKHFKLMADINLSAYTGSSFNIIGSDSNAFEGVFDGNGHTISNFTYSSTGTGDIGLFGCVEGAEIKNLGVVNPNIYVENGRAVGALVGWTMNEGGGVTISDCYVEGGSVSGGESVRYIGGLAGTTQGGGSVVNCYSSATVTTEGNYIGGLIGGIERITINNCYVTGSVSSMSWAGGLVGVNWGNDPTPYYKIMNCYVTGSVSGLEQVGGLIGKNFDISIVNCYATGSVSGTTDVGGLVGIGNAELVFNSYWDTQTSKQSTSAGGTPKTTALMKDATTYTWWGCDGDWTINDGEDYPHLTWEGIPGEIMTDPSYAYGGGSGTENDPYLIYSAEQLNTIG